MRIQRAGDATAAEIGVCCDCAAARIDFSTSARTVGSDSSSWASRMRLKIVWSRFKSWTTKSEICGFASSSARFMPSADTREYSTSSGRCEIQDDIRSSTLAPGKNTSA